MLQVTHIFTVRKWFIFDIPNHSVLRTIMNPQISRVNETSFFRSGLVVGITFYVKFCLITRPLLLLYYTLGNLALFFLGKSSFSGKIIIGGCRIGQNLTKGVIPTTHPHLKNDVSLTLEI